MKIGTSVIYIVYRGNDEILLKDIIYIYIFKTITFFLKILGNHQDVMICQNTYEVQCLITE